MPEIMVYYCYHLGGANDGYLNLFSDLEQIECQ